jgi:UDPglucose 6-dehydrogenase
MSPSPLGVLGAGWVGLVTAACFAERGHEVWVRDIDGERIAMLLRGEVPIHEPGLDELLERNRDRLHYTLVAEDVFANARVAFVCVGTPPTYSGDADLSAVWRLLDELPGSVDSLLLVMKSTVPVGTGAKARAELDARGLTSVAYVANPEFLSESTAIRDFMEPDRVVIGAFDPAHGDALAALYEPLGAPIVRTDVATAEMIKYASNAFLATKISFINEIANVCEATGADVTEVATGMGYDRRIGPHFLRAGLGYSGNCLVGEESVLVRQGEQARLVQLDALYSELAGGLDDQVVEPGGVEVLAWEPGDGARYASVSLATRRYIDGEIVEIKTKMGRRVSCTADHPFVVTSSPGSPPTLKAADELCRDDWVPVALGGLREDGGRSATVDVLEGLSSAGVRVEDVLIDPPSALLHVRGAHSIAAGLETLQPARGALTRARDVLRSGTLRLHEAFAVGLELEDAAGRTARQGSDVPLLLSVDEQFWRVVGLYLAEGSCSIDGSRRRLYWSFHPTREPDLVDQVRSYWESRGVNTAVRRSATAIHVVVSSRMLAGFWIGVLGAGTSSYDHRIPDAIWGAPERHKRALLSGLWRGDGSWSYVAGGPSVVLEYGTVSMALADGMLRLLAGLGIVARLKIGRGAKSTCDTYHLVVSGADQIEALLELVPPSAVQSIRSALASQAKRIAPTGYRRHADAAWVRVVSAERKPYSGYVYSLEVPGPETFVTTGGLVVHNCLPKDVAALKQLAGNSGYHFQLLTAVIEVNELQKRRVVGMLEKHLGPLRGKTVALLGLAFKPNTDDMRHAASLVLAARLLSEGARVKGWDPVATEAARPLLAGVELHESLVEALDGADAAVIVTEWDEVRRFPYEQAARVMARRVIVDGRNVLDPAEARASGFAYESIGRPSAA